VEVEVFDLHWIRLPKLLGSALVLTALFPRGFGFAAATLAVLNGIRTYGHCTLRSEPGWTAIDLHLPVALADSRRSRSARLQQLLVGRGCGVHFRQKAAAECVPPYGRSLATQDTLRSAHALP
jgi:hypothetical protein